MKCSATKSEKSSREPRKSEWHKITWEVSFSYKNKKQKRLSQDWNNCLQALVCFVLFFPLFDRSLTFNLGTPRPLNITRIWDPLPFPTGTVSFAMTLLSTSTNTLPHHLLCTANLSASPWLLWPGFSPLLLFSLCSFLEESLCSSYQFTPFRNHHKLYSLLKHGNYPYYLFIFLKCKWALKISMSLPLHSNRILDTEGAPFSHFADEERKVQVGEEPAQAYRTGTWERRGTAWTSWFVVWSSLLLRGQNWWATHRFRYTWSTDTPWLVSTQHCVCFCFDFKPLQTPLMSTTKSLT